MTCWSNVLNTWAPVRHWQHSLYRWKLEGTFTGKIVAGNTCLNEKAKAIGYSLYTYQTSSEAFEFPLSWLWLVKKKNDFWPTIGVNSNALFWTALTWGTGKDPLLLWNFFRECSFSVSVSWLSRMYSVNIGTLQRKCWDNVGRVRLKHSGVLCHLI